MPSLIGYAISDRDAPRPEMIPCKIELSDIFNQIKIAAGQRLWLWISSEQGEQTMVAEHAERHHELFVGDHHFSHTGLLAGDLLLEPINAVRMAKQCADMISGPVLEDERPNRGVRRQQHRELFRQGIKARNLRGRK